MPQAETRGILASGQEPVAANIGDIGKIGDAPGSQKARARRVWPKWPPGSSKSHANILDIGMGFLLPSVSFRPNLDLRHECRSALI
jgi:hypothetical protein